MTDDGDLEDWRDAAEFMRALVLTGQLWCLPRERIERLILSLVGTVEAACEALERRDRDAAAERPGVH